MSSNRALHTAFRLGLVGASIAVAFRVGRLLGKLEGIGEANTANKKARDKHQRRMRRRRVDL